MYGQMTAGSWIYIGTQGIVQGTYECFAEIARRRFGGSLAGTITLTAGLGGMGGAQPLAVTMNDGVALCVEVDPERIERRLETRYLDEQADDLDDAIARCERGEGRAARAQRRPVPRTPPRSCPSCSTAASTPTSSPTRPAPTTRWSATSRPGSRWPRPTSCRARDPDEYIRRARASAAAHCPRWSASRTRAPRSSTTATACAREAQLGGFERAFDYPGFVPAYIRPLFCEGKGPVPLGGALGRSGRHRRDRPRGARRVPRRRGARPLDPDGRRADRVPGPAGADLLARLRRAAPARAALQRDGPHAARSARRS